MKKPTARDLAIFLKEIPARMPGMPYTDRAVRISKIGYKDEVRFQLLWRDPAKRPDPRCKLWYRNWRHALTCARMINKDLEAAAGKTSFTFDDAAKGWLKLEELRVTAKNPTLSPTSLYRYRRVLAIAQAKFGRDLLHEIKSQHIRKWLRDLGQDFAACMFPTMLGVIGRVFDYAQQEGMFGDQGINPLTVDRVRLHGVKNKRVDIPDRSDMETLRDRILKVLPDGRIVLGPRPGNMPYMSWSNICLAVVLGGSCGLRVSEVCGLTWDRIDPDTREVEISQVISGWPDVRVRPYPKTKAGFRKVPTTAIAQQVINLHAKLHKKHFGNCVGHVIRSERPKCGRGGRPNRGFYRGTTISHGFAELMRDAGLVKEDGKPKFTFHALRHWCASHWIKSTGSDVHLVAKWLGHKNASMTLDVYGHCLDDAEGRAKFMKMPDWLQTPIEIDAAAQPVLLAPPTAEHPLSELAPPLECPIEVPEYAERWLRVFVCELWRSGGNVHDALPRGKSRQQVRYELQRCQLPSMSELKAMAASGRTERISSSGADEAPRVVVPDPYETCPIDVPDIAPVWVKGYIRYRAEGMDHLAAAGMVRKDPKAVTAELRRLKLPSPSILRRRFREKKILELSEQGYQDRDIGRIMGDTGQRATRLRRELHKPNPAKSLRYKGSPKAAKPDARPEHKKQLKLL